ncbi:MAG: 50S ribosomal protein L11 methyltransferase [Deltaproteobacteria bacterium]
MTDCWIEIACDVPAYISDILAEFLSELSGNGVCMENIYVDAFAHDEIVHPEMMTVRSYFQSHEEVDAKKEEIYSFLDNLAANYHGKAIPKPSVSIIKSEEWSTSWRSNFKPLRVGQSLFIVPTWEEVHQLPDDILLRVDPGMAFGTGGHETTRLCLGLLEQIMRKALLKGSPSVLDLGTGSGILAMAAARLGSGRVCAVDIDPLAIEVARENININNLANEIVLSTQPLESQNDRFDIILANILAEELVRLATHFSERLLSGGLLVLSGILAEKEQLVIDGFASTSLEYVETRCEGEWVARIYRKGTAV